LIEPPARIIVVGGGLAGLRAVETLKRSGYDGWLALIGDEAESPYDRPPLSKEVLTAPSPPSTTFRGTEMLVKQGVEVRLGTRASGLDLETKTVEAGGERLPFDALIVATGATARNLPTLEGIEHVHTLRTISDALTIRSELERARHLVVVGAGFVGAEVAASARAHGIEVTIVEVEHAPLTRSLGKLGSTTVNLHRENGTNLRLGAGVVSGEEGADGTVRLSLSDGSTLEADVVVVGVGVVPNIGWLTGSGIPLANGVVCDASLNAGDPSVFAVGDVAEWPNALFERRMRVEHWTNAVEQARHVARGLASGSTAPFVGSNYFWSDQYGIRIQFAGVATPEVRIIDGTVEEHRFVACFLDGDRLAGAFAMASPELFTKAKGMIEERADWAQVLGVL
jgi:NADPH-dependent 2,4-dienoyl-CoA reductase/sulfur reductase-like enzyme